MIPLPPVAVWAAAAATAASAAVGLATSPATLARRGPDESEVDEDGLLEKLGIMGAIDGSAGLLEGGVFDESVALESHHDTRCPHISSPPK